MAIGRRDSRDTRRRQHRGGLTRIELLLVVAVTATLGTLLAVGISSAREHVRRRTCCDNLRQIGAALRSYHQSQGMLPPIAVCSDASRAARLRTTTGAGRSYSLRESSATWGVLLLPHLELDGSAPSFDLSKPVFDPQNAAARAVELSVMKCPADSNNGPDNAYHAVTESGIELSFARGNYAINGGVGDIRDYPGFAWEPSINGLRRSFARRPGGTIERLWGSGVAGFNKSFSIAEFENGLSNIVSVEEVRAGVSPDDVRGVWALAEAGASLTWGHGLIGDCSGPNCRNARSDDVIGGAQLHQAFGEEALIRLGMPCCSYAEPLQATARSMHKGGVHVLMLDGSVRFVRDDGDLNVWHAMHSREARASGNSGTSEESDAEAIASDRRSSREAITAALANRDRNAPTITNSIGMKLAPIPAGEFTMGLPDQGEEGDVPADTPPHRVQVGQAFYLGVWEVTQREFQTVMGRNPSWHTPAGGGRAETIDKDAGRFPVEQVSWFDAVAFCRRLSSLPAEKSAGRCYRLPTEAEWEYSCRAGTSAPLDVAAAVSDGKTTGFNMRPNSIDGLPVTQVGSYRPNAFGLYDMRGNVFEWCADWYGHDYYCRSTQIDPRGPESGVLRVIRGADWRFTGMGCRYTRFDAEPSRTSPFVGFRVVCEHSAQ